MLTLVAAVTGNVITEQIYDSVCIRLIQSDCSDSGKVRLSVYGYSGNTGNC